MAFLIIISIIIFIVAALTCNSSSTVSEPIIAKPTRVEQEAYFDPNNPNDVLRLIEFLAECVANKTDSFFYVVFENDNPTGENKRIIISATLDGFHDNYNKASGIYRWHYVSEEAAVFLDSVPFVFEGDTIKYTYFSTKYRPISYRDSGIDAIKKGIQNARFGDRHRIQINESTSSVEIICD